MSHFISHLCSALRVNYSTMRPRALPCRFPSKVQPGYCRSVRSIASSHITKSAEENTIPVTAYTKESQKSREDAQRTTLHVDRDQQVPVEVKNVSRKAVPFDRTILSKLTPTMRSFTLEGKVAVVTGYECITTFQILVA